MGRGSTELFVMRGEGTFTPGLGFVLEPGIWEIFLSFWGQEYSGADLEGGMSWVLL